MCIRLTISWAGFSWHCQETRHVLKTYLANYTGGSPSPGQAPAGIARRRTMFLKITEFDQLCRRLSISWSGSSYHCQETHHFLQMFAIASCAGDSLSPGQAQAGIARRSTHHFLKMLEFLNYAGDSLSPGQAQARIARRFTIA